ncbi:hypothetical protein ACF0H5_007215 [Mactra antiquata]
MPMQMSTEKFIRAERKNRLETHKLKVTYRHYDKATTRMNYEIDREKRHITKAFKSVIKTSGASDLGIPPKDENDTDFEKCPSYMQGLKLSNKRLQEWRECEKQLDKFITQHEQERAKQKRKKYIKKQTNDYDVIPPPKRSEDDDDDVFIDNESVISTDKYSPIDLLKDNPDDTSEVFDIKKWENDIIESYKTVVCASPNLNKQDTTKNNLKSFSSPTFSTPYEDIDRHKRTRPHTAQPRLRPKSANTHSKQRPASANINTNNNASESKFLITKDSIYIKTGQSFEKLLENRPVDTPLMVNNFVSNTSLKPPTGVVEKEPSIASMSTLCPVQEGDEEEEHDNYRNDDTASQNHVTDGHGEIPNDRSETSQLSMKFQRRLRKKLERARSASTSSQSLLNKNMFKHSNSDLSSYVESGRRTRRDSGSASSMMSMPMSRTGSIVSSHRPSISLGIPADIEEISRDTNKLLSEIKPEKPLSTNKLVSVGKIVRAALTFSRVARKRALLKMQDENSSDSHEIMRQERLRRLQSRQNVLNTITSQWQMDPTTNIEQVE